MRKRRALRQSATDLYRRAILTAAERVFARSSFDAAKIADIATEAGMAAGTLYNYFDSKEAIFQAICEELGEQMILALEAALTEHTQPTERLQALVAVCLRHIEEHRSLFLIFHETHHEWTLRKAGPEEVRLRVLRHFERAIRDAVLAEFVRRDVQVSDLVIYLTGAMSGYIHAWIHAGGKKGLAAKAGAITEFFLHGAGAKR